MPAQLMDRYDPSHEHTSHRAGSKQGFAKHASAAPTKVLFTAHEEAVMEEIEKNFPSDEYEMTLYGVLPRFRPGEQVTMQDFKERRALCGMTGHCIDHDSKLHVWTILLEDGKKIRAVPKNVQMALMKKNEAKNAGGSKPIDGFIAYGSDIVNVILETEAAGGLHRHVKTHVVRPRTPPKEHTTHSDQVVEKAKPKAKRKAKAKAKHHHGDEDEEEEEEKDRPFEVGEMVMMKDAGGARLGVGKIKEKGEEKNGNIMVKVEFGQRGGVYNIEVHELKHFEGCRKKAKDVTEEAMSRKLSRRASDIAYEEGLEKTDSKSPVTPAF